MIEFLEFLPGQHSRAILFLEFLEFLETINSDEFQ